MVGIPALLTADVAQEKSALANSQKEHGFPPLCPAGIALIQQLLSEVTGITVGSGASWPQSAQLQMGN